MQPDLIGGRYRVVEAIGRGGMGTVWRCRDETLHRDVAVKQVGLPPGESVTDSARALREARSSAALNHRNVVTVFDVVEESGSIWLVMERVPGRSLAQIIRQDGPLDPLAVADLGAQVASGLAAAHAAGTMHRDVKPGNVLLTEDGVAKISDFGIARTTGDPALTGTGLLTGTPSYFSPELARGADPGPATDVWALGATLYAAVEGRPAYERGSNPVAVLHEVATAQPPAPRRAGPLEPALLHMLDRDPETRWTMQQAADELTRLAASGHDGEPGPENDEDLATTRMQITPTPPGAATQSAAPPGAAVPSGRPGRPRRRTPRVVAAAVVLLLTLGGGAYLVSRLGEDSPGVSAGTGSGEQPSEESAPSTRESGEQGSGGQGPGGQRPGGQEPGGQERADTGRSGAGSDSGQAEAMEEFVRDYYERAPGGSDEAWQMLGPGLREQGRAAYDRFWQSVESVEVQTARADPSEGTVEVTLTYRTADGRTSTERKREGLVPDGQGGYLLDSDAPAG